MSKLRKKITEDFTCVHNTFIRDKTLSIAAKGLLLVMISLPDDWNFSIVGLQKILPDGKDKIRTTLKILEEKGYLQRNRIRDEKGSVVDWEYCFSDEPLFLDSCEESTNTAQSDPQSENPNVDEKIIDNPHSENPNVDNPYVDKPHMEKPTIYKIQKEEIQKDQILINKPCGATSQLDDDGNKKVTTADKTVSKKKVIDEAVYKSVIGYLNEKANTHYRDNVESNRKYIRSRLSEGYSVDDLKTVIDKKCKEWIETDMVKYLRPDTLFSENHFDNYLNSPTTSSIKAANRSFDITTIDLLQQFRDD